MNASSKHFAVAMWAAPHSVNIMVTEDEVASMRANLAGIFPGFEKPVPLPNGGSSSAAVAVEM